MKKNNFIALMLTSTLALSAVPTSVFASSTVATPSSSALTIDGTSITVDSYMINYNNYVKLRDIATLLDGTSKNFQVIWNNDLEAIEMFSNMSYTPVGGELSAGDKTSKEASKTTASMFIDGKEVALTAYEIDYNNYFQLRDVLNTFGAAIDWNQYSGEVSVTTTYDADPYVVEILKLANIERAKVGVAPLTLDSTLTKVAQVKSDDMANNNYFSHTSPTYGSAADLLDHFNIEWYDRAENIAYGQTTPQAVTAAWMASTQGHRENLLNPAFTKIGTGYNLNGNYWTQIFTD